MNLEDLEWTLCPDESLTRHHTFVGNIMIHKWSSRREIRFFCLGPEGDGLNTEVSLQFSLDYQPLVIDSYNGHMPHSHMECISYPNFVGRIPCVESRDWEGVLLILSKVEEDIAQSIKEAIYA